MDGWGAVLSGIDLLDAIEVRKRLLFAVDVQVGATPDEKCVRVLGLMSEDARRRRDRIVVRAVSMRGPCELEAGSHRIVGRVRGAAKRPDRNAELLVGEQREPQAVVQFRVVRVLGHELEEGLDGLDVAVGLLECDDLGAEVFGAASAPARAPRVSRRSARPSS